MIIETVGVGQAETEVADVADTVAVVVQPGSGDALQFLKSGIMEIPDVLVVTKSDLGQIAMRTRRDLSAALRSLGARSTDVLAVTRCIPPAAASTSSPTALDRHRARIDLPRAAPVRTRRAAPHATSRSSTARRHARARRAARCAALLGAQDAGLDARRAGPALEDLLEEQRR